VLELKVLELKVLELKVLELKVLELKVLELKVLAMMQDNTADIQTVETSGHVEDPTMEKLAYEAAQVLTNHYPNYPWCIGWAPGFVLVVKLLLNPDFNYGYTLDCRGGMSFWKFCNEVKMAGGELLERLELPIGAWDGRMPEKNIEGVDKDHAAPIFKGINRISDDPARVELL
jgi:hypothetical protein